MRAIGYALAAFATAVACEAHANCTSLPYTLSNGSPANADQVMADLNCFVLNGYIASTSSYQVDVAGTGRFVSPNISSTGGVIIRDASGDPDANYLQWVNNANSAQYAFIRGMKAGGLLLGGGRVGVGGTSATLTFYVSGTAGGTSAWSTVSDGRLKTNVRPITNALDYVTKLRGVRFNWRPADSRGFAPAVALPVARNQVGFVAQEVAQVIPEAVNTPAATDQPYTIKEADIIPFLVEAVKQQQRQITALRAQVAALRRR